MTTDPTESVVTFTPTAPAVWVYAAMAVALILFAAAMAMVLARYKRCPSNRVLVVFGKVGHGRSYKCLQGGGTFVMPLVQDYSYLSLEPIRVEVTRVRTPSQEGVAFDFSGLFTVAVTRDPGLIGVAAERLLNLPTEVVRGLASDAIEGRLKLTAAALSAAELDGGATRFAKLLEQEVAADLSKLGLELVSVNLQSLRRQPT